MSQTLALTATALETAASASTSANPTESGYWKRIAAASETLAGATTSANATTSGYMLRAALALESVAGTSGVEENINYSGYLKRIVDALEVQAGAITVGSLEHRLVLAAQNATFGGDDPVSLWPQPVFADAAGLTLAGWTVGSGQANSNAQLGLLTATALETMVPGNYRLTGTVQSGGTSLTVLVGGALFAPMGFEETGFFNVVVEVATVLNQLIRLKDGDEVSVILSAFNVETVP